MSDFPSPNDARLQVLSVDFSMDRITVNYLDPNRQQAGVTEVTQLQVDPGLVEGEAVELLDAIEQFVQATLVVRRAPAERLEGRVRR